MESSPVSLQIMTHQWKKVTFYRLGIVTVLASCQNDEDMTSKLLLLLLYRWVFTLTLALFILGVG